MNFKKSLSIFLAVICSLIGNILAEEINNDVILAKLIANIPSVKLKITQSYEFKVAETMFPYLNARDHLLSLRGDGRPPELDEKKILERLTHRYVATYVIDGPRYTIDMWHEHQGKNRFERFSYNGKHFYASNEDSSWISVLPYEAYNIPLYHEFLIKPLWTVAPKSAGGLIFEKKSFSELLSSQPISIKPGSANDFFVHITGQVPKSERKTDIILRLKTTPVLHIEEVKNSIRGENDEKKTHDFDYNRIAFENFDKLGQGKSYFLPKVIKVPVYSRLGAKYGELTAKEKAALKSLYPELDFEKPMLLGTHIVNLTDFKELKDSNVDLFTPQKPDGGKVYNYLTNAYVDKVPN